MFEIYYLPKDEDVLIDKLEIKSSYDIRVFTNLLNYLTKNKEPITVLLETNYIDRDYRSAYSVLYSKMYQQFSNYSARLHFFGNLKSKNIKDFLNNMLPENLDYYGYTCISPIEAGKISRTILSPFLIDSNKDYHLCIANYTTSFLGYDFKICATPFIEQDFMVMCCGHTTIWMAMKYMQEKFNLKSLLPHEIVEAGSKRFAVTRFLPPTYGIAALEMFNILISAGYSPIMETYIENEMSETKEIVKDWNPLNSIYPYIESAFPVIAMKPGHAFLLIGHTFSPTKGLENLPYQAIPKVGHVVFSENWVDSFIAHDEGVGPYRIILGCLISAYFNKIFSC